MKYAVAMATCGKTYLSQKHSHLVDIAQFMEHHCNTLGSSELIRLLYNKPHPHDETECENANIGVLRDAIVQMSNDKIMLVNNRYEADALHLELVGSFITRDSRERAPGDWCADHEVLDSHQDIEEAILHIVL